MFLREILCGILCGNKVTELNNKIKALQSEVNRLQSALLAEREDIISSANVLDVIQGDDMYKLLMTNTTTGCFNCVLDERYRLTSDSEIKRFLDWSQIDKDIYEADWYDCDDFAVRLWGLSKLWSRGLALGYMHIKTPGHAINFYVNEKRELKVIEPQSDDVFDWGTKQYGNTPMKTNAELLIV